ncbi:hypothetical protein LSH36_505g00034 [Paralvinella palmiformis]|uniref:G-protein coupled receptors family 1 profile domain-containing protein n=1 Tax=Paralvinella palmiformis TaxID=53620 RepID=A0AAD9J9Q4_9ANNE|nr:hypothetical protein LSH36_505g00034 [Paralvinella palmiformis]
MADSNFVRELICGTSDPDFINLTLETLGSFRFDQAEEQRRLDEANHTASSFGAQKSDYLCVNTSEWDRESLLGNDGFRRVMDDLNVYLTPIIILLGVAGNFVTFLVFTTTHLNRQSSSIYLASLAVVDMLFLWCLSMIWLSWVHVDVFHRHVWCQCIVYMTYVCTFLSVWYVVSFTIERYIIVYYPLKKDLLCTRRRAKTTVTLLAIVALVLYSFSTVTNGSISFKTVSMCTPLTRYYTLITIATACDFLLTLIIPSVIIIVMNVRIIIKIVAYSKQSVPFCGSDPQPPMEMIKSSRSSDGGQQMTPLADSQNVHDLPLAPRHRKESRTVVYVGHSHFTGSSRASSGERSLATRRSCGNMTQVRIRHGRTRAQHRTARMLIIVSSVFVILHLPNHLFRIHAFLWSSLDERYSTDLMALKWHELFQLLWHLNFSINFFLYSVCGRQFRRCLHLLCTRLLHKCCSLRDYLYAIWPCTASDNTVGRTRVTARLLNGERQPGTNKNEIYNCRGDHQNIPIPHTAAEIAAADHPAVAAVTNNVVIPFQHQHHHHLNNDPQ